MAIFFMPAGMNIFSLLKSEKDWPAAFSTIRASRLLFLVTVFPFSTTQCLSKNPNTMLSLSSYRLKILAPAYCIKGPTTFKYLPNGPPASERILVIAPSYVIATILIALAGSINIKRCLSADKAKFPSAHNSHDRFDNQVR
jgi:hypothetical protein